MTELRAALQDYLTVRRALGYKLTQTGRLLGQFVAYCEQSDVSVITTEVAVAWATLPAGADTSWWAQRLSTLRCFAMWVQTLDPATEIPPTGILTGRPRRAVPYLYTDADVVAIMHAAGIMNVSPPFKSTAGEADPGPGAHDRFLGTDHGV